MAKIDAPFFAKVPKIAWSYLAAGVISAHASVHPAHCHPSGSVLRAVFWHDFSSR
jgi:hypothetical protein